jgi:predicted RNase H-like nuclease
MERVVACGIDGYPRGWVVAALVVSPPTRVEIYLIPDIGKVIVWRSKQLSSPRCAIDIPIGLPDEIGLRPCDHQARALIGARRDAVFPVPDRELLQASNHSATRELVEGRRSTRPEARSISAQTFGIVKKITEVDAAVRSNPSLHSWLVETHPEVAFTVLAGRSLPPKKHPDGIASRLEALRPRFPNASRLIETARQRDSAVAAHDVLDACAALWSGVRYVAGVHQTLGGELSSDGIPMRMII